MFDYISGKIQYIKDKTVVLDVGGVGFEIHVPTTIYNKVKVGENCKLFVELCVREDSLKLYGFLTLEEREIFEKLQTISGIGPSLALNILCTNTPSTLREAILREDTSAFKNTKGLGPKLAKRIVTELKSDVQKLNISGIVLPIESISTSAINALVNLGYPQLEAVQAVEKALKEIPNSATLEDIIRKALLHLA